MLKDKAQPTVVDELSGRIDEVDENQKESSRYSLMLLLSETSSPERNLGYRRPAYFYLKLCDRFKKIFPGETWYGVIALDEKYLESVCLHSANPKVYAYVTKS
jgi:hypothetical protein